MNKGLQLLVAAALFLCAVPSQVSAADDDASGDWQFFGEIYGWGSDIGSTAPGGTTLDLSLEEILDNLDFTFMAVLGAQKGRWTFALDTVYMDLSKTRDFSVALPGMLPDLGGSATASMTSWVISPTVLYKVMKGETWQIDVLGGLRYLDVEAKLDLTLSTPNPGGRDTSGKDSFDDWNGVVGARGRAYLTRHVYLGGYLDIGTGDSDFTWQTYGIVGYQFERLELNAGYRYTEWDFGQGDNDLMTDLSVKGPFAGVAYRF